ncbi:MAG: divergent polysaccharide deacetylase family protein [Alphaproteobacteria bacterium]
MSPPAFAAVLLVLAIGGVLAWLALSADKSSSPPVEQANATLTIQLGGEESKAADAAEPEAPEETQAKGKSEEANTAALPEPAVEAGADEAAVPEVADQDKVERKAIPSVDIARVTPPAPVEEVIALALPDPALLQETSRGALPIIGPDGREPWRVYGRDVGPASDLPRMAVIVSGLGLSTAATKSAIKLPKEVTLSFTPYGADLETDGAAARAAGHEVLLDLPMEPISYPADDPGPHTLLTSLNPSDNIARLDWLLGRFKGYVGVITHMGSRFTASPEPLRPILRALKDRGLMFVDSRSTSKSVAAGLAGQMQLPRAINDRFLDHEPTRGAIDQSFAAAEGEARARGVAVVVARPFPVTLERMAAWLPMLDSRGIEIVPVTALADKQANR